VDDGERMGLIYVLVSNDIVHDQRVKKTCESLQRLGWDVMVLGRELPESDPLPAEAHFLRFVRLRLGFRRGAFFYAALQFRILVHLLFRKMDGIWANDLDTLLPAFLVSRLRGIPLVYDSHEFFTEAAGLTGRPFQRWVWLQVERAIQPRLRVVLTVNPSIARLLHARYPHSQSGLPLVLRNMPRRVPREVVTPRQAFQEVGIPVDRPIALLQGAFMDADRGIREAVEAVRNQEGFRLVLIGAGEEWNWAAGMVDAPGLQGRLFCLPKMPFSILRRFTASADVGLSLDRALHGNYLLSLPNKLFDYIHAGIPVVASALPEVEAVVRENGVGRVVTEPTPEAIRTAIEETLAVPRAHWSQACESASSHLHWEADEPQIAKALEQAGFRS